MRWMRVLLTTVLSSVLTLSGSIAMAQITPAAGYTPPDDTTWHIERESSS